MANSKATSPTLPNETVELMAEIDGSPVLIRILVGDLPAGMQFDDGYFISKDTDIGSLLSSALGWMAETVLRVGSLELDLIGRAAKRGDRPIHLSPHHVAEQPVADASNPVQGGMALQIRARYQSRRCSHGATTSQDRRIERCSHDSHRSRRRVRSKCGFVRHGLPRGRFEIQFDTLNSPLLQLTPVRASERECALGQRDGRPSKGTRGCDRGGILDQP